ncbi:MAG: hypothetical protein H0W56_05005 [Acidothermales bacterium]|nr:hypothetical protein [Acidothermales bacterium]
MRPPRPLRTAAPAAVRSVFLAVVAVMVTAAPAHALARDAGDAPGEGLTVFETLLLYVVVPGALFLGIAALVVGASAAWSSRARAPADTARPVWFGGPEEAERALESASPTRSAGGTSGRW